MLLFVEMKTKLKSGSIRCRADAKYGHYTLVDANTGDFILHLPDNIEMPDDGTVYEDNAILIRK